MATKIVCVGGDDPLHHCCSWIKRVSKGVKSREAEELKQEVKVTT